MTSQLDAVVVGSGPNGLAAAITLARAGRSVRVVEGSHAIGGGMRSAALTLDGFRHDVCSAIHPLAVASPFFRELDLERHGLRWVYPPAAVAHPFDDGTAVLLEGSVEETAAHLGEDSLAYQDLVGPLVERWDCIDRELLGPFPWRPRAPLTLAAFGIQALRSARGLAEARLSRMPARGLLAGLAGHSVLPLEKPLSAAVALVLAALGHRFGWPFPRGGADALARALAAELRTLGGEIETGHWVRSLDDLPPSRVQLLDVTPGQLVSIGGERLPAGYREALARFRHGPGVCKVDFALEGPIPWTAPGVARAGTVHLGGTLEEIADAERQVWQGRHPRRPFVLVAQHTLFDPDRAPRGRHTAWAYTHVPHGSERDVSGDLQAQIERFAPGFSDLVLARHVRTAAQWADYSPNYVGGDITGGVVDVRQLFTRPVARWNPYSTPVAGLYLCSSSTPPGAGVHGMCGVHAARSALRRELA